MPPSSPSWPFSATFFCASFLLHSFYSSFFRSISDSSFSIAFSSLSCRTRLTGRNLWLSLWLLLVLNSNFSFWFRMLLTSHSLCTCCRISSSLNDHYLKHWTHWYYFSLCNLVKQTYRKCTWLDKNFTSVQLAKSKLNCDGLRMQRYDFTK